VSCWDVGVDDLQLLSSSAICYQGPMNSWMISEEHVREIRILSQTSIPVPPNN
jgi:hypothetical protein